MDSDILNTFYDSPRLFNTAFKKMESKNSKMTINHLVLVNFMTYLVLAFVAAIKHMLAP